MTIQIKCFASLRESLGVDCREIAYERGMQIADAWRALSAQPPPPNLLCARNHEYVDFNCGLADGDEVAFFPPVTGG